MNKRAAFQMAAVVGIVGIACVLYNVVPRYRDVEIRLETPPFRPLSEVFQTDLLAAWNPPKSAASPGKTPNKAKHHKAPQEVESFVRAWTWAAQPHLSPLSLGPPIELAALGPWEQSRLNNALEAIPLLFLKPTSWDSFFTAATVGSGAGPMGPLSAAVSLIGDIQLHSQFLEKNILPEVVIWGSRTTNVAIDNTTSRKTYTDRFTAGPEEADRALRSFRERLQEKVRELGAQISDPAETVRDNRLESFAFNYVLGSAHGRITASIEPALVKDRQLRVEVEEEQE